MKLETLYFYTATITNWKKLLAKDKYKVELLTMNGKEMPHASFMKYTSHEFLFATPEYYRKIMERTQGTLRGCPCR